MRLSRNVYVTLAMVGFALVTVGAVLMQYGYETTQYDYRAQGYYTWFEKPYANEGFTIFIAGAAMLFVALAISAITES